MNLIAILFILFEFKIYVCMEEIWNNFKPLIETSTRMKIASSHIFVFDAKRGDFVSLANETHTVLLSYQGLQGKMVQVAAPELFPYIKLHDHSDIITGFVGDIWTVFQEFLKFKTNLTRTTFNVGSMMLIEGKVDIMLTAGVPTTDFPMLEYTQPYFYNWYQLYMRLPSRTANSTFYVRTLTPTFWYACILLFLILTVTLRFTVRILNRVGNKYHGYNIEAGISTPTCFLSVISGFLNQGFDVRVRSYAARIQVILALLFGYTVYTAMSAVLVSELAVSDLQLPIKSLEDLATKGKWSLCVRNDSFVHDILMEEHRYASILNTKRCENGRNGVIVPKEMLCELDVVVLEAQAIMTNHLMNEKLTCEILTINGKYYRRGNSIMVYKGFKYRKLIYIYLERLRGHGILNKLQNQWVRPMKPEDVNPTASIEVTLPHVKGILIVYVGTLVFSVFVLACECAVSRARYPNH